MLAIEISDDGRGINKARVLEKAIERGMADPARTYTDKEIFEMLFAPGLSTADRVSELSGRGVGMDIVRSNIQRLGGIILLQHGEFLRAVALAAEAPVLVEGEVQGTGAHARDDGGCEQEFLSLSVQE